MWARHQGRALNEQGWRLWVVVGAFINKGEPPHNSPPWTTFIWWLTKQQGT